MLNIAIDGPAGAGKSTVAKSVAEDLGIIYLDTGAMYRATAYCALRKGIDVKDVAAVENMLESLNMDIVYENGIQQIYVNGMNATPFLREHYMSKAASDISAVPAVRYKMVDLQREFAKKHDVVLDGRDIGTFVLPQANCKIYLTASPEERANRRFKELTEKGMQTDFDTLLADIIQRDYNDSHREVAPLKQAEDAVYLDTTKLSLKEAIDCVKAIVKEKIK
jgi:cytidylate kinase